MTGFLLALVAALALAALAWCPWVSRFVDPLGVLVLVGGVIVLAEALA